MLFWQIVNKNFFFLVGQWYIVDLVAGKGLLLGTENGLPGRLPGSNCAEYENPR